MAKNRTIPSEINYEKLFQRMREHSPIMAATGARDRLHRLKKLEKELKRERDAIAMAIWNDFHKPPRETDVLEFMPLLLEIHQYKRYLKSWMKPARVIPPLAMTGISSRIIYEPKGIALVITPWNFPLTLALDPVIAASMAGNCTVLKPSEFTPHTNKLLKLILARVFPPEEVSVVEGDAKVSTALLKLPFDHIHFTGSPAVGKIVMSAAARNLTPVTLELGGKSPTIIDKSADLDMSVRSILFGKFANAGQTCIAPDYLLVHRDVYDAVIRAMNERLDRFYGGEERELEHADYSSIIHRSHYERLKTMLAASLRKGDTILRGGRLSDKDLRMNPTLIKTSSADSPLMQEEIFGPLLPVITFETTDQAIQIIARNPKPLALYLFSRDQRFINKVIQNVKAGTTSINETLYQYGHAGLPFGGIGASGMGKSHGHSGFLSFSNERAVLHRHFNFFPVHPPYGKSLRRLMDLLFKIY